MGELRDAMGWFHTWAGVILGGLLFAIFWTGTLSVFDREIDRWMMEDTRLRAPEQFSLDEAVLPWWSSRRGELVSWSLVLPTARSPAPVVFYRLADGSSGSHPIDSATGAILPDQGTHGATGFFLPFHYMLHLEWEGVGYWIVGAAATGFLAMLISGVIIHRRIFADFFMFRTGGNLARSTLDMHNVTGVLALPFHFAITLSGLLVFATIYFPQAADAVYPEAENPQRELFGEAFGIYHREAAGLPPVALASLDAMVAKARDVWDGDRPSFLRVQLAADANHFVEMRRAYPETITLGRELLYFDATTGELLERFRPRPVMQAQRFFVGLHLVQFDHWTLRWLYFVLGLAGCVTIASGLVYWVTARRKRHLAEGLSGVRIVEAIAAGSVTAVILATLAFLIANRLLPAQATLSGIGREELEVWIFFLVWAVGFAHAALRAGRAWCEQCRLIALAAAAAFVLNAVTTGDHLLATMGEGLWAVAGVDLALLAAAAIAMFSARRLSRV